MMYWPVYGPDGGYQPWRRGPGMMYGPGYNYSSPMMRYGDMMALYYPGARPISQEEALQNMKSFSRQYGSNVVVEAFTAFSGNYYAVLKDQAGGQGLVEVLVNRHSGSAYPEPGPNTMWNTRYGSGRTGPEGAQVLESEAMPGSSSQVYIFFYYLKGAVISAHGTDHAI